MESKKTLAIGILADEIVQLYKNKNDSVNNELKECIISCLENKEVSIKGKSLSIDMGDVVSSLPSRGRGRPRKCLVGVFGSVGGVCELNGGVKLYGSLWGV